MVCYWERGGNIEHHQIEGIHSHYIEGFSILPNLLKVVFVCCGTPQQICKRTLASTLVFINSSSDSQTLVLQIQSSSFLLFLHHVTQNIITVIFGQAQCFRLTQANLGLTTPDNISCQSERWVRVSHFPKISPTKFCCINTHLLSKYLLWNCYSLSNKDEEIPSFCCFKYSHYTFHEKFTCVRHTNILEAGFSKQNEQPEAYEAIAGLRHILG